MRLREWLELLHSSFSGLQGIRRSLRRRSRRARRISSCPAIIELLEDRTLLSAIVVNSVADNVTSGDGEVTFREAINAANSDSTTDLGDTGSGADTIEFELGLGSHVITLDLGQPNINDNLRIAGLGADRLTVSVSDLSPSRAFQVGLGATVELSGLTISDGLSAFGSGGGIVNFGTLTVRSSVISGNSAGSNGGGIFSSFGTTLTIVDSEISNNIAGSGVGGGIHSFAATTTVTNSTISGNSACCVSEHSGVFARELAIFPCGNLRFDEISVEFPLGSRERRM